MMTLPLIVFLKTVVLLYFHHLIPPAAYRLGGPDPLDYISMYRNKGDPAQLVPPHWHYVTCGFSDLHGDGRVHE